MTERQKVRVNLERLSLPEQIEDHLCAVLEAYKEAERIDGLRLMSGGLSGAVVLLADIHYRRSNSNEGPNIIKIGPYEEIQKEAQNHRKVRSQRISPWVPPLVEADIPGIDGDTAVIYHLAGNTLKNSRTLTDLYQTKEYKRQELLAYLRSDALDTENKCLKAFFATWNGPEDIRRNRQTFSVKAYLDAVLNSGSYTKQRHEELQKLRGLPEKSHAEIRIEVFREYLPNPLAYALRPELWENKTITTPIGYIHSDLRGNNILCGTSEENNMPYIIDFARYEEDAPLFFDLAYLELDLLMTLLQDAPWEDWRDMLEAITQEVLPLEAKHPEPIYLCENALTPLREQVQTIIHAAENAGLRESFEQAWWAAAFAVGMLYVRRDSYLGKPEQKKAYLYAAYMLKRALKALDITPPSGNAAAFTMEAQPSGPGCELEAGYAQEWLAEISEQGMMYVDLIGEQAIQELNAPASRGSRILKPYDRGRRIPLPLDHLEAGTLTGKRNPLDSVRKAMRDTERILLLGEPGSGKTTTLLRLTYDYAEDLRDTPGALIPVLVPLAEYHGESVDAFKAFVREQVTLFSPELADHFDWLWERDRLVLLCDSLNEMPSESDKILESLQGALKTVKRVAVSCRVRDFENKSLKDAGHFGLVQIKDLTPPLIKTLIEHYLYRRDEDEAWIALTPEQQQGLWVDELKGNDDLLDAWTAMDTAKHAEAFWLKQDPPEGLLRDKERKRHSWLDFDKRDEARRAMLGDLKGLMLLCRNPYMLFIVIELYRTQGSIPENRGKLFEEFVYELMDREKLVTRDRDTQQVIEITSEGSDLLERLTVLAGKMQLQSNVTDLEKEEALALLKDDKTLKLAVQCSLLQDRGGSIRFAHQLMQEYFAARQMVNEIAMGTPATHYWKPENWWERTGREQTALILAGVLGLEQTVQWLAPAQPELALDCVYEVHGKQAEVEPALREVLVIGADAKKNERDPRGKAAAYRVLGRLNADFREGIGLNDEGLPDIYKTWRNVPAGTFWMGSDKDKDEWAQDDELPQHEETIPYDFKIGKYLVTYQQFQAFLNAEDGFKQDDWWEDFPEKEEAYGTEYVVRAMNEQRYKHANHPRESVSWYQAVAFTRWLTQKYQGADIITENEAIRLPTECEWEYAARGKKEDGKDPLIYPYGYEFDATKANTSETGIKQTSAVGLFENPDLPFEVQDMSGNVWEWCVTKWGRTYPDGVEDNLVDDSGNGRVVRGGSFVSATDDTRCACRSYNHPLNRFNFIGFRVVLCPKRL